MMYRNFREYNRPQNQPELEILRSWLRGETGTDSLKIWLGTLNA
jgi:hypothetical protein